MNNLWNPTIYTGLNVMSDPVYSPTPIKERFRKLVVMQQEAMETSKKNLEEVNRELNNLESYSPSVIQLYDTLSAANLIKNDYVVTNEIKILDVLQAAVDKIEYDAKLKTL